MATKGAQDYVVVLSRDDGKDEYYLARQVVYAFSPAKAAEQVIDRFDDGRKQQTFTVTVRPA